MHVQLVDSKLLFPRREGHPRERSYFACRCYVLFCVDSGSLFNVIADQNCTLGAFAVESMRCRASQRGHRSRWSSQTQGSIQQSVCFLDLYMDQQDKLVLTPL